MAQQSKIEPESLSVRFTAFGQSSLDLEVKAHVLVRDGNEFLGIQEDLLLRTIDIIEASGTSVALPSQMTYIAKNASAPAGTEGTAAHAQHRDP